MITCAASLASGTLQLVNDLSRCNSITKFANVSKTKSPNFGFLVAYDDRLLQSALAAERLVFDDPVAALMRLRQFGELLAQEAAALVGVYTSAQDSQIDLLRRLSDRRVLTREVSELFHDLRRKGNAATHESLGSAREALHQLRMARTLALWFHRSLGNHPGFQAGAFVPPPNPDTSDRLLNAELDRLREQLVASQAAAKSLTATAAREASLRLAAEQARALANEELEAALELAQETEAQAAAAQLEWEARLAALQAQAEATPHAQIEAIVDRAQAAGEPEELDLDEAATRRLIDAQLIEAGWEADTVAISFKEGVRPTKGKNLAIAEWPTSSGPADYVLFTGLTPIAVVEAKRKRKDVVGAIEQAKRYSRDYVIKADERLSSGPWGKYKIPFLFATNGRPFLRQLETKSGIWFLDARRSTNHPGALDGWRTPSGLAQLLGQDHEQAEAKLELEPTDYLGLREYQIEAIHAVEAGIVAGKRELLLAMATGTGKTRTALGLIYRLLKTGRFRRVLFLVDRSALGEQAHNAFKSVKLEQLQSIDEIYDIMGLADAVPDDDTRLHIATIQGMVNRLKEGNDYVPVDRYDCIIVDESHRGYNLDRDMSEGELEYRSQDDYVSKYRRVLDHFDAVRIGLTATPALHTSQIFGRPVFEYSYRKAVIEGYLVDHEPPIRIITNLNQNGIHWAAGEQVTVYRPRSGQLDLYNTPDEIDIEIDGFNTKVITESFNEVVCQQLAAQIDPSLPGKVMIFCATDDHADLVVKLLKAAFARAYGEIEDDAVMKITGAADKPLHKIRLFKNEALPKVAVTVDLLTTGIDVPQITTLVFIRRVKSRILYEQMLGARPGCAPRSAKRCFGSTTPWSSTLRSRITAR
jgi:type I restriction enzyme, R subunit